MHANVIYLLSGNVLIDWLIDPHLCRSILIHSLYHWHYPFIYTQISQCPLSHLSRHPVKCFLQINKSHSQFFILHLVFTLQLTDYENSICRAPNCILAIFTIFLNLPSITRQVTCSVDSLDCQPWKSFENRYLFRLWVNFANWSFNTHFCAFMQRMLGI